MTIIYIHGVNVRSDAHGKELEAPFRRWLGPKLGGDPAYEPVYWGGQCASQFRWGLASRPKTAILGMGSTGANASLTSAREAPVALQRAPSSNGARSDGLLGTDPVIAGDTRFIATLAPDKRADFLADLYLACRATDAAADPSEDAMLAEPRLARVAASAADVAEQWDALLDGSETDGPAADILVNAVDNRVHAGSLLGQGAKDWLQRAGELVSRSFTLPGDIVSSALAETRPALNNFVANFLGDVFTYLDTREPASGGPGVIPALVIDALKRAQARKAQTGERIVVVTHSMGGQLLFDAVTRFASLDPELEDLVVDVWLSCACQVSFFAELGLFRGVDGGVRGPAKLDRPARVAKWVNFYDTNDFIGFIQAPVFGGVEDKPYNTGYGLALAHTGFLTRPSFFKSISEQL